MRLADNDAQRDDLYLPVMRGERTAAFAFTEALRPDGSTRTHTGCTDDARRRRRWIQSHRRQRIRHRRRSFRLARRRRQRPRRRHRPARRRPRRRRRPPKANWAPSIDGSTHSPFTFDAVPVPESRLLGAVGDGLPRAMQNIDRMRLGVAADCIGWSRWVTRATLKRIEGPHRSGQPLAEQQQVQAIFADMVADTFAARTSLYRAAEAREADEPTAGTQVATAKWFASECLHRTVDRAIPAPRSPGPPPRPPPRTPLSNQPLTQNRRRPNRTAQTHRRKTHPPKTAPKRCRRLARNPESPRLTSS